MDTDENTKKMLQKTAAVQPLRRDSNSPGVALVTNPSYQVTPSPGTSVAESTHSCDDVAQILNAGTRYLLVKAHVGFGDRLQALSHAIRYAECHDRTLCVDWSDTIWSDGVVNFDTYFDICGVPVIPPNELYQARFQKIVPMGWVNQLDRRAELRFLNRSEYILPLSDEKLDADVVVYGSIGHRVYCSDTITRLRVKKEFRNKIVANLVQYRQFDCVVHLRGTDRRNLNEYEPYLQSLAPRINKVVCKRPFLVVTDSQLLFERLQRIFPEAVLRTPNLDRFAEHVGTHFQFVDSKREYNLQMLIDFFLLVYARECVSDGESIFSEMARFLHRYNYSDILGYDR